MTIIFSGMILFIKVYGYDVIQEWHSYISVYNEDTERQILLLLVLQSDLCKWKGEKQLFKAGDLYIIHVVFVSELNSDASRLSKRIPCTHCCPLRSRTIP